MGVKEEKAKEYADSIPYYQDRRIHAAEDFLAGWEAAMASADFMQQKIDFEKQQKERSRK